ncbi:tissue factor pathway inhibitor isoform X2 [Desmodus rotundus]|nr:tissue factor pathway inhibitor isoform X2 [Desmodus rotundus]
MKIKPIFGVSVCLLLTCASLPLNAEEDEYSNIPDFCLLGEDPGPCRGYITRYFYNNQSEKCDKFKYGGCLGNPNNFDLLEECKNTCENPLNGTSTQPVPVPMTPPPPPPIKNWVYVGPSWCRTPADRGLCRANITRFYFDSVSMKCLTFSYTGCGGNENNFISSQSCRRACRKGFIKKGSKGGLRKDKRIRKKHSVGI